VEHRRKASLPPEIRVFPLVSPPAYLNKCFSRSVLAQFLLTYWPTNFTAYSRSLPPCPPKTPFSPNVSFPPLSHCPGVPPLFLFSPRVPSSKLDYGGMGQAFPLLSDPDSCPCSSHPYWTPRVLAVNFPARLIVPPSLW